MIDLPLLVESRIKTRRNVELNCPEELFTHIQAPSPTLSCLLNRSVNNAFVIEMQTDVYI